MNEKMNHFDAAGNAVMVDVGEKILTERVAVAAGKIFVGEEVYQMIESGTSKKGDVLGVARKTTWKTGAEMEALHAASVALLTIYDMCKAIDKRMALGEIRLEQKSGGKSGYFKN